MFTHSGSHVSPVIRCPYATSASGQHLRKQYSNTVSITFGEHSADVGVEMENGMYDAIIRRPTLIMDNGQPKTNENGKKLCDVFFEIDAETTVKRRYAIGFGQNTANKQWAAFAKMIEAATGIKCGDKAQRSVTDKEIDGKPVRIVIENNDRGYADVSNVLPPARAAAAAASRPRPQPVPAEEQPLDDIPF